MSNKIIYGAYCRKSSESEERQVQSIEDQLRDLETIRIKENLQVLGEPLKESRSAHYPGRPNFTKLVSLIESGKINGILTWHPNRLSRNPVDSGTIIYLMDRKKLLYIKTPSKTYVNTPDDKFMLQLDFGMSKKDSDDKGVNVKRGLTGKAIKGYPTGVSKIGYLNDKTEEKGNRKWIKDNSRFPLVKLLFQMFLSGKYSVPQVHKYAIETLKLTTPQRKREGGKPVAQSYVYSMLADPIYAGFFFYENEKYKLHPSLERVINEDEYWKIQSMLGQKGRPRMRSTEREGLYNYLMKDQDGGAVTPDFKFQVICECKHKFSYTTKNICPKCGFALDESKKLTYLSYVYYYSSREKKQKGLKIRGIEEKQIDKEIIKKFSNEIQISQELSDWCIRNLSEIEKENKEKTTTVAVSQDDAEEKIKIKLSRLLDLRLSRDDMTEDEASIYKEKEDALHKELEQIKGLKKMNHGSHDINDIKKKFCLMSEIMNTLENGSRSERKSILMDFGSNLTLNNGIVSIFNAKEVEVFADCLKKARGENPRFEPKNSLADKEKTDVFTSVIPTLLRG